MNTKIELLKKITNEELLEEARRRKIIPSLSADRIKSILIDYIDNDLEAAEPEYVRDVVSSICTTEEMKELGLYDWLGFDE